MLPVLVSLVTLAILVPPGEAFQGRAPRVPDVRPLSASSPRHRLPIEEEVSRQVAPPPAVSVPVWSLTCPVSIPAGGGASGGRGPSASMSILTYVTPVSVSSPKLWAMSLFKTSFTRCCFLGVPNPGEEYNDSPAISSSVNYSPGSARSVRRRAAMGEAGVLGDLEGSSGWRAKVRAGEGRYSIPGGPGQTPAGVGVLQLLSPGQSDLVPILGKATGWDGSVDKGEECSKLAHGWARVEGRGAEFEVLPDCASYLEVRLKRVTDGGDHDVALAEIIGVGAWDGAAKTVRWLDENEAGGQASIDPSTALYSGQLRTEGII